MLAAGSDARTSPACPKGLRHPEVEDESNYIFFDDDRKWMKVSLAAATLLQCSPDELVGARHDEMLPQGAVLSLVHKDRIHFWQDFERDGRLDGTSLIKPRTGPAIAIHYHAKKLADGCIVVTFTTV
jgi:PAS domain-containing protein